MKFKHLVGALLSIFIVVANNNGLFGYNEDRTQSQIQQDQVNNPVNQSGKNRSEPPQTTAYPPLPE